VKRGHLVILLVEDDDNDVFLVRKATHSGKAGHRVYAVHDGEQAIAYLRGTSEFSDREKFPLPNVILTDLKMPRLGGFELLHWLRANGEYGVIPTIVYSSSQLESDIREAYRLGANSYMSKPATLSGLIEMLRVIYEYWSRCECPPLPSK
jgi:CheY-like chemotaxis protein